MLRDCLSGRVGPQANAYALGRSKSVCFSFCDFVLSSADPPRQIITWHVGLNGLRRRDCWTILPRLRDLQHKAIPLRCEHRHDRGGKFPCLAKKIVEIEFSKSTQE
jgi:hypothetical protein